MDGGYRDDGGRVESGQRRALRQFEIEALARRPSTPSRSTTTQNTVGMPNKMTAPRKLGLAPVPTVEAYAEPTAAAPSATACATRTRPTVSPSRLNAQSVRRLRISIPTVAPRISCIQ